jgi:hypothetical protein
VRVYWNRVPSRASHCSANWEGLLDVAGDGRLETAEEVAGINVRRLKDQAEVQRAEGSITSFDLADDALGRSADLLGELML